MPPPAFKDKSNMTGTRFRHNVSFEEPAPETNGFSAFDSAVGFSNDSFDRVRKPKVRKSRRIKVIRPQFDLRLTTSVSPPARERCHTTESALSTSPSKKKSSKNGFPSLLRISQQPRTSTQDFQRIVSQNAKLRALLEKRTCHNKTLTPAAL